MHIFKLPDLGEGLPDAEIHQWYVAEGDHVLTDQPLVSMETAKAVVDVPSPQDGIIAKIYGQPGDIIKTGDPLIEFISAVPSHDQGTVVGNLEESASSSEDNFVIGSVRSNHPRIQATFAVKSLAKKLQVDLMTITPTGADGTITHQDVERAHAQKTPPAEGYVALHGVRRSMAHTMSEAQHAVAAASIFDDADIAQWPADADITVRLIRALVMAISKEPALNAWFDGERNAIKLFPTELHLGLAMDHDAGLFVPVIRDVAAQDDDTLRQIINGYKRAVEHRDIAAHDLKGATFTLSNFGKFAGKYATPIVVPPQVAILAVGRRYNTIVRQHDNIESHAMLPLSLSFDHRAVTGGEASRFLKALIDALQQG